MKNLFKFLRKTPSKPETSIAKAPQKEAATAPSTSQAKPTPQAENHGHEALLKQLEGQDPVVRLQIAGKAVLEQAMGMISGLGGREGVRVEDLMGLLGSTAGYACIVSVLEDAKAQGATPQALGLNHVGIADGKHYYFGAPSNRPLVESEMSVLGLSLGMAKNLGADVSLEPLQEAFGHVAATIGTPEFGQPRLPEAHRLSTTPAEFVRHLWPRINDVLDLFQVPVLEKPAAIGFAIQQALQASKDALDPVVSSKIIVECAVPMAKLDPAEMTHQN